MAEPLPEAWYRDDQVVVRILPANERRGVVVLWRANGSSLWCALRTEPRTPDPPGTFSSSSY